MLAHPVGARIDLPAAFRAVGGDRPMAAKPRRVSKARTGSAPFLRARELDHVNIKVSDMSASLDFYVGFLGLSKDWEELDAAGEPDFVGLRVGSQTYFLSRNRDY